MCVRICKKIAKVITFTSLYSYQHSYLIFKKFFLLRSTSSSAYYLDKKLNFVLD